MELVVYDELFFSMAKVYILLFFFFLWIYKMKLEYVLHPRPNTQPSLETS